MKKVLTLFLSLTVVLFIHSQTPAFPGAEGGGMYTTGGREGKVLYVTSLEDTNTQGTLRWAINQTGKRMILFKISGIIALNSTLEIKNGDLTIAGQTAPGDGICIKNYSTVVKADNVIIRYIRFRMGDEKQTADDALWGRNQKNIIIDHCSMSWSTDECASFYDNTDFTMQWCILSESLRNSVHDKGRHGYGGIWGGKTASFHHNLLAHHDSRNPRMCGSRYSNQPDLELVDFRNNIIYNWGANSGYAGEGGRYNFINNYYKPGPASSNRTRIFQPNADDGTNSQSAGVWGLFYVDGNYMSSSDAVTKDNWQGITPNPSSKNKNDLKSSVAFAVPEVSTHSAIMAYDKVRDLAGASYVRDAVDERIVREVSDSTSTYTGSNGSSKGLIDSQSDVGGWPTYNSDTAPEDSDNDGIPNGWLEKNYPGKTSTDKNEEGYTYLEVYLNDLVADITAAQLKDKVSSGIISVKNEESNVKVYYDKASRMVVAYSPDVIEELNIYSVQSGLVERVKGRSVEIRSKKYLAKGVYIVRIKKEKGNTFTTKILIL